MIRFEADFPNERWQSDMTHVNLADGRVVEVLNMIDDHSRLCVAARVFVTVRSPRRRPHAAQWGYPASFLPGWRVIILIAGLDIQILGEDGSPLRKLTLDLTKDYQRQP